MADLYFMVAIAIILILLTYLITKKLKKSLNIVILIGIPDAGKTAIFSRIVFNKPKKTVTSLKENEASVNDLNIRLIDLPGAERLRVRLWGQYRSKANHIMYIVDSAKITDKVRDVSEYLYQVLADDTIHKNRTKFTIVCHKQDEDEAKSRDEIKVLIEEELNAIKNTREGQLGKTSEEEEGDYLIGRFDNNAISLDSLSVNLIETSINNLDQLIKIIL